MKHKDRKPELVGIMQLFIASVRHAACVIFESGVSIGPLSGSSGVGRRWDKRILAEVRPGASLG
jgi:hypothetical protein